MEKVLDCVIKALSIAFLGVVIFLIYFNIRYNDEFLKTPIWQILNLLVAMFFAYYLTQKKNDERKFKDNIDNIINKIQAEINDPRLININCKEDTDYLLMVHRSISNRIELLDKNKEKLIKKEDIEYVKNKFQDYREFVSTHISDLAYLKDSKDDFFRYTNVISTKLDVIKMSLY